MFVVSSLLVFLPVVAGEPRAVCPDETVEAFQGDDVRLQCHTEPEIDLSGLTLDWKRPDLEHFVYVYRNKRDDPQYRDRMKVDHVGFRRGDLTLFIPSVGPSDSGPYRCFIPVHRAGCAIQLNVVNRTREVFSTVGPSTRDPVETKEGRGDAGTTIIVVLILVVTLLVILGVFGWKKWQKKKKKDSNSGRLGQMAAGGSHLHSSYDDYPPAKENFIKLES